MRTTACPLVAAAILAAPSTVVAIGQVRDQLGCDLATTKGLVGGVRGASSDGGSGPIGIRAVGSSRAR